MTDTRDKLIEKLEEFKEHLGHFKYPYNRLCNECKRFESEISELKEQIKKEEFEQDQQKEMNDTDFIKNNKINWDKVFKHRESKSRDQQEIRSANDTLSDYIHCLDLTTKTWNEILEAMEAYANQFRSEQREVTDEDIEKAAKEFQTDTLTSFNQGMYSGFIFGAIAMRNGKIKTK